MVYHKSLSAVAGQVTGNEFATSCICEHGKRPSSRNLLCVFVMQPEIYLVNHFFALPYCFYYFLFFFFVWRLEGERGQRLLLPIVLNKIFLDFMVIS